jgi:outer membrane immunogenic protein
MRRKLLYSAAFLLAGIGTAGAADILPETYDTDWTGFYGTLSGGYSDISVDASQTFIDISSDVTDHDSDDSGGAIFGIGAGYNRDFGCLVLGLEGDVSMLTNESQLDMKNSVDVDYDWFATGRLRAGIDLDGTLLYATGGVAGLRAQFSDFDQSQGVTFWGWTAGGGIEHMISDRLSVRLEALYADFGSESFHLSPGFGPVDTKVDPDDMFVVRAGVSLRF